MTNNHRRIHKKEDTMNTQRIEGSLALGEPDRR
jgi:hypothetical protein